MNENETRHKLEQAEEIRQHLDACIASLQAQLTEKPKPLRHLDCGYRRGDKSEPRVLYKRGQNLIATWPSGGYSEACSDGDYEILFNAGDDLAALKPIKEFEIKSKTTNGKLIVSIRSTDRYGVSRPIGNPHHDGNELTTIFFDGGFHFAPDELHEIILNLRCMELKLKQDEKGAE